MQILCDAANVGLINDQIAPGLTRWANALPVERMVDDKVDGEWVSRVKVMIVFMPVQDRRRIGVEKELARAKVARPVRIRRPLDPEGIPLAVQLPLETNMPDITSAVLFWTKLDNLGWFAIVPVEQQQADPCGMPADD